MSQKRQPRTFSQDDLFKLEFLLGAQLSPDGQSIAWHRCSICTTIRLGKNVKAEHRHCRTVIMHGPPVGRPPVMYPILPTNGAKYSRPDSWITKKGSCTS